VTAYTATNSAASAIACATVRRPPHNATRTAIAAALASAIGISVGATIWR